MGGKKQARPTLLVLAHFHAVQSLLHRRRGGGRLQLCLAVACHPWPVDHVEILSYSVVDAAVPSTET